MVSDLFNALEERVVHLLEEHALLKREIDQLKEENLRLLEERDSFRARIDAILRKLEDVESQ